MSPTTASVHASHPSPTGVRLLLGLALVLVTTAPHASAAPASDADEGPRTTVSFDCLLQPFHSGFRYEATMEMVAAREPAGLGEVELSASLSDLPGISPAQIDDGTMRISLKGTADGNKFRLEGTSQVTSAPKVPVPMPRVSGRLTSSAETLDVEVTDFRLAFEEMMGLNITATCLPAVSGGLGTVAVGSGGIGAEVARASQQRDEADVRPSTSDAATDDSFPMVVLWGLGAVGAALIVWLARRRLQRT